MDIERDRKTSVTINGIGYTGKVVIMNGQVGDLALSGENGNLIVKGIEGITELHKSLGSILSLVDKERGVGHG